MSVQAITWVLEDAPNLPAHLVGTLLALANHADRYGRGSFPGQATVAWYARKSDRQIRKDLMQLRKLGLIREGDQRLVAHIAADERPVVYDLAMDLPKRERPKRDRNSSSARKPEGSGTTVPVPRVEEGPEPQFRPELQDRNYRVGGTGTPVPTNRPLNQELSLSSPPTAAGLISAALGLAERESQEVLNRIRTQCQPRSELAFVRHLIDNGDITAYAKAPTANRTGTYSGPTHAFEPDASGITCALTGCGLPKRHPRHG